MLAQSLKSPAPSTALECHGRAAPGRAEVERFISGIFRERYGADVRDFAPLLVARRDGAGTLVAAAGYRPAEGRTLFLERYLDRPVHDSLHAGRHRIVEVGHLAAARAGEGRKLILQLGPHLAGCGFQWVVSTLTEELRHLFLRLGIAPQALGVADPALLGDDVSRWGSYYEHHPLVAAGAIGPALQALARRAAAQ
jgi:Thermostable hemolysin